MTFNDMTSNDMPSDLTAPPPRPLYTTADAFAAGITREEIRLRIRRGHWLRLRRGVYTPTDRYRDADPRERYLFRLAALLLMAPGAVASHTSAALLHNLALLSANPNTMQLEISWIDHKRGDPRAGERVHRRQLPPEDLQTIQGIPTTTPARTVADLACTLDELDALVAIESALFRLPRRHRRPAALTTAREALTSLERGPRAVDSCSARRRILAASDLSESPAETLLRQTVLGAGFTNFQQQITVSATDGSQLAQVDGYLPQWGIVLEADGMLKYRDDPQAFKNEKRRHESLLDHGLIVIRIDWEQLRHRPKAIIQSINDAIAQRGRLARPVTAYLAAA